MNAKSVRKLAVKLIPPFLIDIFALMMIVISSGLLLTNIQERIFEAVDLISANPEGNTMDALIANNQELSVLFSSIKINMIYLILIIFILFGISQFFSFLLIKKDNKINMKKYFSHFITGYTLLYSIFLLIFYIYIKLRFFALSLPIQIIPEQLVSFLFVILLIVWVYFFINTILSCGDVKFWNKWKKINYSKYTLINYAIFALAIWIISIIFDYFALFNPTVFYSLMIFIIVIIYSIFRRKIWDLTI